MSLDTPIDIALIGTGNRSQRVYYPLFATLQPWVRVVAVCDPVRENADNLATKMGVPAFYSLHDLIRARPMEAALVVTPIDSHYAISCYLSQHKIHNLVETTMASMLEQAQQMVQTAQDQQVVVRVAENFFRFPFDRLAKKVADTGFIGSVKRLTCFHDHLGFHNNSRWLVFYGAYPESVQAIAHTMPTAPHHQGAFRSHRYHEHETFQARFFRFPEGRLAVDMAGNIKGMLGRYPRPGYTELDGQRGAIVRQATQDWQSDAEVRYCSDRALQSGAVADEVFPFVHTAKDGVWASTHVDLPTGRVEYVNPYRETAGVASGRDYYAACVVDHIVDFAYAVRGVRPSEYTDEDALMAMTMEVAARESALHKGKQVDLPLTSGLEAEGLERESLEQKHGVDPLDIEGMLAISYPKP